jgi:subtilase family serine protease
MSKELPSRRGRWIVCVGVLCIAALILLPNPRVTTKASGAKSVRQASNLGTRSGRIGEVPALVTQSTYQGPMPATETLSMNLSFQVSDEAGLHELVSGLYDPGSANFHHWLTPQEFGQRFGRSQDEIQQATAWLTSKGLVVNQVLPNMLSVLFSGTAETVQQAFGVTMSQYTDESSGRVFYSNDQAPSLPSDVQAITADLVGMNNAYRHHPGKLNYRPANLKAGKGQTKAFRRVGSAPQAEDSEGDVFMGPAAYATVYDITPLANAGIQGQNQRVGIIGDSDVADSDAADYRNFFNLPPANIQRFTVPNATGPVSKDMDGELEASLDYSCVSAIAPDAEIDLVLVPEGELTFANTLAAEEYIVNTLMIPIVNESFGGCESISFTPTEAAVFQQAVTEGIAFFASTGDNGAECVPALNSFESETAMISCPNCYSGVTAVGGTTYTGGLLDTQGNIIGIQDEAIWNNAPGAEFNCKGKETPDGGAGGGGISTFVSMPDYQVQASGFSGGVPSGSGRIVPDVSLLADPNSLPAVAFLKGDGFLVGGTSEASPLWAGMMALINQSKGQAQGSPNTELYRLASAQFKNNGPLMFTDITEGNNSIAPITPCLPNGVTGFEAAVGFDAASGWGPPDLNVLAQNYGVQTLTPITIPPPPPVIQQIVLAELDGDTLTVGVVATDPGEAITQTQATLLDGNQAVVSTGAASPISLRHSFTTAFTLTISGLDQLPSAENVTVMLTDKYGQNSGSMSANFAGADPGGPTLTNATLSGKKLVLEGSGFDGKLSLEVNGLIIGKKGGATDTIKTFKGSQAALNLHSGVNRIRVELGGLFSNIFLLQL